MRLPRCGAHKVIAAHDFGDALVRVIDDDGQVVRPHPVRAPQHHVIDGVDDGAVQGVLGTPFPHVGAQSQRRPPALRRQRRRPLGPLGLRQIPAGPGVRTGRAVGCPAHFRQLALNVLPGAVTGECRQTAQCRVVKRIPLGLPHGLAVPIHADRREVGELLRLELGARPLPIDVLDAHEETPAGRPRTRPRDDGGPQVAQVQVAGRRRRVPADVSAGVVGVVHATTIFKGLLDDAHLARGSPEPGIHGGCNWRYR